MYGGYCDTSNVDERLFYIRSNSGLETVGRVMLLEKRIETDIQINMFV